MHKLLSDFNKLVIFLLLITCFLTLPFILNAQSTSKITGKVIDENQKALPYVSVTLIDAHTGKLFPSSITNKDGFFSIPGLYKDSVALKFSSTGFDTYQSKSFIAKDASLQRFTLHHKIQQLKEVTIQAQKSLIKFKDGKITVDVANNITAQGSTAYDQLSKAPGVNISSTNDISLNGKSGVKVMIDGKLVYLEAADLVTLLKSTPASAINSIDILAIPPASYDAAGSAGIIEIHTKKLTTLGFKGSIGIGAAYYYLPKTNADVQFNYRTPKLNFYGNYSQRYGWDRYAYSLDRLQSGNKYTSATKDTDKRSSNNAILGLDYHLTDKQTIGFSASGNFHYGPSITHTLTTIVPDDNTQAETILRATNIWYTQLETRYQIDGNYAIEDTSGNSINFDADYGTFSSGNKNLQPNIYYDASNNILKEYLYRTINNNNIDFFGLRADVKRKISTGQLIGGLKFSSVNSVNDYLFYDEVGGQDIADINQSNHFRYKEDITALYLAYSFHLKKININAGLRAENTHADGVLMGVGGAANTQEQAVTKRYTNLFPTVSIGEPIADNATIEVGYTRRIDRPAYKDLNPFAYLLDELTVTKGNPFLQPQLSDKYFVNLNLPANYYITFDYTYTSHFMANVTDTLAGNKVLSTPKNAGNQEHLALTSGHTFQPFNWWQLNASVTVYHVWNDFIIAEQEELKLQKLSYNLNLQQTFSLPWQVKAELTGGYTSSGLYGANDFAALRGQLDAGFNKPILKNQGSLSFTVNDIFYTAGWYNTSRLDGATFYNYGKTESRIFRINFRYNFGNSKVAEHKQHDSELKNEGDRI